jgi:alpha/beta superfamily hydrolase
MARLIESCLIPGPAGNLEARIEGPEHGQAREACVVCHPHPLYGGTMHNKVVHRLARGLRRSGSVVLRFHFRGVGKSQGVYDRGIGEVEDARAAMAWLRARYPGLPLALAGFSFGAKVILRLGCEAQGVSRLIALGTPTRGGGIEHLARCPTPKVFIQSTRDEFGPKMELEAAFSAFSEPKRLVWIEAADHFFRGGLDRLEQAIEGL